MTDTFTALLLVHVLTDFVFQTARMAEAKAQRSPAMLALHIGTLIALGALALAQLSGGLVVALGVIGASHLLIDIAKSLAPRGLTAFLIDQAAHLGATAGVAALFPDLWAGSVWVGHPALLPLAALLSGAVVALRAGGFAVALLMARFPRDTLPEGLPEGGRLIGLLERAVIFTLVIAGQPTAIGFLIAAKSILRFEAVSGSDHVRKSEYVIIGTLASFGWALASAYATVTLIGLLPPLGIPAPAN